MGTTFFRNFKGGLPTFWGWEEFGLNFPQLPGSGKGGLKGRELSRGRKGFQKFLGLNYFGTLGPKRAWGWEGENWGWETGLRWAENWVIGVLKYLFRIFNQLDLNFLLFWGRDKREGSSFPNSFFKLFRGIKLIFQLRNAVGWFTGKVFPGKWGRSLEGVSIPFWGL